MNILFVNTNIGYGGASKMMVWVASQMAEKGHDVTFFTYRSDEKLQILNPKVKHIHNQLEDKAGKHKHFVSCVKSLHELIVKGNYDVVIAFLSPSILRVALASIKTDCKVLFSERADPSQKVSSLKLKIIKWVNRIAFNRADAFVFQTPKAASFFSKKVQENGVVIPNPIRPLKRTKKRVFGGDKTIVCVARLDIKQKRQDLLIDAFIEISHKYPYYSLCLYGDGLNDDEVILREKAIGYPNVKFMGPTTDVVEVIQNATMFVLSSDFEGIPNALLESMSIGVPSVSTDCSPGGAAMLIRNKENGLLVPKGDVKALATAMEFIITHPAESERMAIQATEVNELYAETEIAGKWESFLTKLK